MKIHGLTVCVDYGEYLLAGLRRWLPGLETLTIATTPTDPINTIQKSPKIFIHKTEAFYANGASFNKGAAMEEARVRMVQGGMWDEWALFFDADIVPEVDWFAKVQGAIPRPGGLYSAWRRQCGDPLRPDDPWPKINGDGVGVGYFQLFHTGDPALRSLPVIETHWLHAGNYDNGFMHRWDRRNRHILPIRLSHICPTRDNWFGRGKSEEFAAMQVERKRRGGKWDHERINGA